MGVRGQDLEGRCSRAPLGFGHFRMTAERSNRIAQAAVAKAMAPLVLWYVTPKSQPRRRLSEVGCFSPGETLKQLALKEATDAQVCALAIRTESEARKALNLH